MCLFVFRKGVRFRRPFLRHWTYPYSWWECDGYPPSLCPLSEFVSIHSVSDDNDGTRSEPIELTALSESPPALLLFCTMVVAPCIVLLHGTEPLVLSINRTGYIPPRTNVMHFKNLSIRLCVYVCKTLAIVSSQVILHCLRLDFYTRFMYDFVYIFKRIRANTTSYLWNIYNNSFRTRFFKQRFLHWYKGNQDQIFAEMLNFTNYTSI